MRRRSAIERDRPEDKGAIVVLLKLILEVLLDIRDGTLKVKVET